MKKILILLFVFTSFAASAQPGYTKINSRYSWLAGKFDSTFHVPSGTTPSLRTGGYNGPGGLFYRTTDSSLYTYTGTQFLRLAKYSDVSLLGANNGLVVDALGRVGLDSAGVNPLGRAVQVDLNDNNFTIYNVGVNRLFIHTDKTTLFSETENSNIGLVDGYIGIVAADSISINSVSGVVKIPNLTSGSATDSVMTWQASDGKVRMRNAADFGGGSTLFGLSGTNTATGNVTGSLGSYILNIANGRGFMNIHNDDTALVHIRGNGLAPLLQVDSADYTRFRVMPDGRIQAGDSIHLNLFIGFDSGGDIIPSLGTDGRWNISLAPRYSLENITTGNDNVSIATSGLRNLTTGYHNVAINTAALTELIDGHDMIAIGVDVGINSISGHSSVLIGSYSGFYSQGYGNTVTGHYGMYGNGTGPTWTANLNTGSGWQVLRNITTSSNNSVVGERGLFTQTDGGSGGGYNAVLGATAAYTSNKSGGVYIGAFSGYYADKDNVFYVHNSLTGIADEAEGEAESMLYGNFGVNGANNLRMNGEMGINKMPDSTFDVNGSLWTNGNVRFSGVPTTTQARVAMFDADGNLYSVDTTGLFGGGSGGSPAGNYGNIQLNRNGAFATPGSDSLSYTTSGGLIVNNLTKVGGELWLNKTFQPYHATNDKQFRITNNAGGTEGLFMSISNTPIAYIETTAGYNLIFNVAGNTNSLTFSSGGIGVNRTSSTSYAISARGTIADDDAAGNYKIKHYSGSGTRYPTYTFYDDDDAGLRWETYDKIALYTNGTASLTADAVNSIGIGTGSPDASAKLDITSTTKGFLPPRMTTTEKNAISSPAEGLVVYDLTLHKLCVYTGSAWETITSL